MSYKHIQRMHSVLTRRSQAQVLDDSPFWNLKLSGDSNCLESSLVGQLTVFRVHQIPPYLTRLWNNRRKLVQFRAFAGGCEWKKFHGPCRVSFFFGSTGTQLFKQFRKLSLVLNSLTVQFGVFPPSCDIIEQWKFGRVGRRHLFTK